MCMCFCTLLGELVSPEARQGPCLSHCGWPRLPKGLLLRDQTSPSPTRMRGIRPPHQQLPTDAEHGTRYVIPPQMQWGTQWGAISVPMIPRHHRSRPHPTTPPTRSPYKRAIAVAEHCALAHPRCLLSCADTKPISNSSPLGNRFQGLMEVVP